MRRRESDRAADLCELPRSKSGGGLLPHDAIDGKWGVPDLPAVRQDATTGLQTWARYYDTGTYATSYLLVDKYGRCLEANSSDIYSGDISELTVTGCNGSDAQKWNAPPTYANSSIGGYREVSGG